jgi:hypothetical protein
LGSEIRIAEVRFFVHFLHEEDEITLALVSLYSNLDPTLVSLSANTLWSCQYQGDMVLRFIDVKTIQAVVSIVPHTPVIQGQPAEEHFFLVEKPGLDITVMTGTEEDMPTEELNDAASVQDT